MEATAIGPNSSLLSTQAPTTRSLSDLSSEDFFGLLIAELQSQDPLKPMDNQQILSQMSTIRQMEQSATLNKTLQALAGEQRFGATAGLIGHYVLGAVKDQAGNSIAIEGIVTGVEFSANGEAILQLHNGKRLPAGKVELVTLLENLPQEIRDRLGLDGQAASAGSLRVKDADAGPAKHRIASSAKSTLPPDHWASGVTETLDHSAALLDALFSPGVSVGV